jgi:hypothetical protein
VDLEIAEPATDTTLSRRSLVTRVGAAGLAGLAAVLAIDRGTLVSAAGPDDRPGVPTDADIVLLNRVIELELAISELYRTASEGASEDLAMVAGVMATNHRAYAEAIAGATGLSAGVADPELVDANIDAFTGSTTEALTSAHTLEQAAVATHTELINEYESSSAIALTASIAVVEARHATVIADMLGVDDLDVLFGNVQPAIDLTGDDA